MKIKNLEKIKKEIVEALMPIKPEKIILFGSYAQGNPSEDSDIDLYVVTNDDFIPQSWSEKSRIHLRVANKMQQILRKYPTDLLTHTKAMHKKFIELRSSFSKDILQEGITIYEAN